MASTLQYLRQIAKRGKNRVWAKSQLIDFTRFSKSFFWRKWPKFQIGEGIDLAEVFSLQSLFRVEARMIHLEFTPEAITALHHERFHHPHPRVQRKMDVLLLKSNGLSHKKIARITRVSVNTVTSYVRDYQQGGIDQLKQVNFYKPRSPLHDYRGTIESYFREKPPASIKEAMDIIEKLTGIRRSATQVRVFLLS